MQGTKRKGEEVEMLLFILGLVLGGTAVLVTMSCIQISRDLKNPCDACLLEGTSVCGTCENHKCLGDM